MLRFKVKVSESERRTSVMGDFRISLFSLFYIVLFKMKQEDKLQHVFPKSHFGHFH